MANQTEMDKLMPEVEWNNKVKLIVSDVDETIADLFVPASPEMAAELNPTLTPARYMQELIPDKIIAYGISVLRACM